MRQILWKVNLIAQGHIGLTALPASLILFNT